MGRPQSSWLGSAVRTLAVASGVLLTVAPTATGCGSDSKAPVAARCTLNSDCDAALVCTFGRCHAQCRATKDCRTGERCVQADGVSVCQLDSESLCSEKEPCDEPLVCASDERCRNGCTSNDECLEDQVCAVGGFCAEPAEVDSRRRLVDARDGGAGGGSGTGGASASGGAGTGGARPLDASVDSGDPSSEAGPPIDAGPEDCANGTDDNGDGKVDCADPRCGAHTCADPVPTGFTGPVIAWIGQTGSEPACPAEWGTELFTGTAVPACDPAACTCACDPATGQSCRASTSVFWNNTQTCPNGNGPSQPVGSCTTPNVTNPNKASIFLGFTTPSGGSCAPKKSGLSLPSPAWAITGRVCGGAFLQGGCAGGVLCTPAHDESFKSCVYREGDVECPAVDFTEKQVLYAGYSDSRACDCTCGGVTGGSCTDVLEIFSNGTCAGAPSATVRDALCSPVSNVQSARFSNAVEGRGSCTPTKTLTGTCTPAEPTTVCCKS